MGVIPIIVLFGLGYLQCKKQCNNFFFLSESHPYCSLNLDLAIFSVKSTTKF